MPEPSRTPEVLGRPLSTILVSMPPWALKVVGVDPSTPRPAAIDSGLRLLGVKAILGSET
jgi:hypothetical protein